MSWYILAVIPVLGLLVFVHELGHFLAAKWAGIRVEEFSLGFPPTLVSIRKRERGGWDVLWLGRQSGELEAATPQNPFDAVSGAAGSHSISPTLYSLGLLPIGGFVRMPGENGDVADEHGNIDPDSFAAKPAGKRIVVLLAGVIMNFLLAMILFTIAYGLGQPTLVSTATLGSIESGSPAQAAGLQAGDTVLSINGQPVKTFDDMHNEIVKVTKGQPDGSAAITVVARHNGSQQPYQTVVHTRQGIMGVSAAYTQVRTPLWQAPWQGIKATFDMLHSFLAIIGQMITGRQPVQLSGPVGVAQVTGQVAQMTPTVGWFPILSLTALLSINIAFFNILPFPALDGGRIVLVLIEILRGGKRLKPEREGFINFIGFAFLLILMVVVTVSDVMHL